ncbi:pectin lyase-like protein [Achaetomium macrosporum]|uniref:galacturonan 1,4-alpha-galacturonidase n=1 Tax=Achaetomium macrosporum TaxID=79813 RepID=A0AAN7C8G2_9PEZI|nr:pectin lyase-like protein [Achaetomium macrosporum]
MVLIKSFLLAASLLSSPKSRPHVQCHPKNPSKPIPSSPPWTKTCYVDSNGDGSDDSQNILKDIHKCNPGGHVVFSAGTTYIIRTASDLTFLKSIDLDIQGTIQFTNDTDYWQANSFYHTFQNATTFFQLGGEDVNVFGGGTIDGNGQVWYDLYAADIYILRPILFGTVGLKGGVISGLNLRYSPQWYNFVANSSDIIFDNINIAGGSKSSNIAKNTDGWDTYRSDNIVIQYGHIDNGDCVSFKPNSTNIVVQGLQCNGNHGISVGSLGQDVGEVDTVKNITMSNASDGTRIKVWPGSQSALSGDLQGGGGGSGRKNVTLCNEYPSSLVIENVVIQNFKGTTSTKYDPLVGYLVCSSPTTCHNITVQGMEGVKSPKGNYQFTCANIDESGLHVNCTSKIESRM